MTEYASSSPDEYDRWYRQGKFQIDVGQYEEAITSCDRALEYNANAHEAWSLRGSAFDALNKYKQALASYERALEIQKEIGNLQAQAKTLLAMIHLYSFNGKVHEGFLAQQQWVEIIKQLDLSPDDALYPIASKDFKIPTEQIPFFPGIGWIGKLMGFAMRGKLQGVLFFIVWLLLLIPGLMVGIPVSFVWWIFRRFAPRK